MKCIVSLLTILFPIVCSAEATITLSPQSFDLILSDGGPTLAPQNNNATRTVTVSNPITFSTKHKRYHQHTTVPQYDLRTMSTSQLVHYFIAHGYTQEQILKRQNLFVSAAFVALAKQLPKYPEYIKKYYEEYRDFNWYTKFVGRIFSFYSPGLQATFTRLYQEYEDELLAKKKREQRKQEEDAAYCTKLETITHDELILDAVPYYHQQARE